MSIWTIRSRPDHGAKVRVIDPPSLFEEQGRKPNRLSCVPADRVRAGCAAAADSLPPHEVRVRAAVGARSDSKNPVMTRRALHHFDSTVGQRHRYGCYHDFRDTDTPRDSDLVCGGRREIDDTAFDVGAAVFDSDDGALPGGEVGDSRNGSERQGPACGVVAARIHRRAIGHGLAEELTRIKRGLAAPRLRREVRFRRCRDSLWRLAMRRIRGADRREHDSQSPKEEER